MNDLFCACGSSQEGVDRGLYSPLEVSVETVKGLIICRTYQINNFHASLPSPEYKQVCKQYKTNKDNVSIPKRYLYLI